MENKMATPLRINFSTAENQVSQCDEQTFGSTSEFKEASVARAPLAKSSKQVSVETDEALCEPTAVLWRNKKAGPQYKGQNLQPVTFENLVVYFDQEKFCNAPIPRIRRRYGDVHTRGENTLTRTLSLSTRHNLHIHKGSSRK